jgi:hypothetical protein
MFVGFEKRKLRRFVWKYPGSSHIEYIENDGGMLLIWALFLFNSHSGGGVQTGSTRHAGHFWPIVSALGDCEDGEFGGIKIGRGNRNTRRKPASETLCPPQIPLYQTWVRTRAAVVGS